MRVIDYLLTLTLIFIWKINMKIPNIINMTMDEIKNKYSNGIYITDPLEEYSEISSTESNYIDMAPDNMTDYERSKDFDLIFNKELISIREKLKEIEHSEDPKLLKSMYYLNFKSRVKQLETLKKELENSGWDFGY